MDYTVLVHFAEECGCWTQVPALPGCFSQGESAEEALANTKEAIRLHLEALRDDGHEPANDSQLFIARVSVAA